MFALEFEALKKLWSMGLTDVGLRVPVLGRINLLTAIVLMAVPLVGQAMLLAWLLFCALRLQVNAIAALLSVAALLASGARPEDLLRLHLGAFQLVFLLMFLSNLVVLAAYPKARALVEGGGRLIVLEGVMPIAVLPFYPKIRTGKEAEEALRSA